MDWQDRIITDPRICHGKPTIKGTRVTVTNVLALLRDGRTIAQVVGHFPYVTEADVRAALDYAIATMEDEEIVVA